MKTKKLLLSLVLLIGAATAFAQKYSGNTPESVRITSNTKPSNAGNKNIVYLYNLGMSKFAGKGGYWGTQLWIGDDEYPLTLYYSRNGYNFITNDGQLTLITSGLADDINTIYVDQTGSTITITAVGTETAGAANAYKIAIGNRYMVANGSEIQTQTTVPTDANGYWQLVTKKDLVEDFNNIEAAGATPAECSFVINDPGFWRKSGDIGSWKDADGNALTNGTTAVCRPHEGDSIFHYEGSHGQSATDKHDFYSFVDLGESMSRNCDYSESSHYYVNTTFSQAIETQSAPSTYVIGNGYGGDDTKIAYNDYSTTDKARGDTLAQAQHYYGGDWTANIHGKSGRIYQSQTVTQRAGTYMVKCQGFSTDGTGYLFAYAGDSQTVSTTTPQDTTLQYNAFPKGDAPTYVAAAKLINTNTGYEKSVIINVQKNQKITFGVFVENGTDASWTCFDNFSMQYLGTSDTKFILDEEQTDTAYINKQVDPHKNQTLYLKRSLKANQWNSIVLPVTLSSGQIKGAFGGDQVKVSKLNRTTEENGYKIIFEPVSLDTNSKAIEAGQLYIIKPISDMPTGLADVTSTKGEVTLKGEEGYYTIRMVSFTEGVKSPTVGNDTVTSETDNGIQHCGTYVAINGTKENPAIAKDTYILSSGKWYYNTVAVNKIKGFRGWIATNAAGTSSAKPQSVVINGVEELIDGTTTAIEGITEDAPAKVGVKGVYTLGGQKVSDAATTEGLAKGLYIIDGKKVVVK